MAKAKSEKGLRIIELRAQNVKRLRAVRIRPDGAVVTVGGRNKAGKTSVLDAIMYALSGKGAIPSEPIRKGANKADIELDLGEFRVHRTFTPKGGQVEVTSANGNPVAKPQTFLDSLVGSGLAFDPLEFLRMKPAQQGETLRRIAGLDFTDLDTERERLYLDRTTANRQIKELDARVNGIPVVDAPDREVSVNELADELKRRLETAAENQQQRQTLRRRQQLLEEDKKRRQITLDALRGLDTEIAKQVKWIDNTHQAVAALSDPSIEPLQDQIANVEQTNAKVRQRQQRAELEDALDGKTIEAEAMTQRMGEIDTRKAEIISKASLPVAGLTFDANQVRLNGIPFDQASQAEQLHLSVGVALAMNPKVRICLIRDGSLLDSDSRRTIVELTEAAGGQTWLETVSEDGRDCTVVIEDGEVGKADAAD